MTTQPELTVKTTLTISEKTVSALIEEWASKRGYGRITGVHFQIGYVSESDAWGSSSRPVFKGCTITFIPDQP